MKVEDFMTKEYICVSLSDNRTSIAKSMIEKNDSCVLVVDQDGKLVGMVTGYDLRKSLSLDDKNQVTPLAKDIMTKREKIITVSINTAMDQVLNFLSRKKISQVPVLEEGRPVGMLSLYNSLMYAHGKAEKDSYQLAEYRKSKMLLNAMSEGVVVTNSNYVIVDFNKGAERISGIKIENIIGKESKLYKAKGSLVRRVMESGIPLYNKEIITKDGSILNSNIIPIFERGVVKGVMQTLVDVTSYRMAEIQLMKAKEELDKAFALTLPNSQVEKKLKATPEYKDYFDTKTKKITITDVINDGGYQHVINALKVTADLNEKGLFSLLGLDKDILVQALTFHDVGKSQPQLKVGQIADPIEVFEKSHIHAFRSAEIAQHFYSLPENVVKLIKYHHHSEEELPEDFPSYLKPMLRMIKIIDGLSAGITRRNADITFSLNNSRLTIIERNDHPAYHRKIEIDIYSGSTTFEEDKEITFAGERELLRLQKMEKQRRGRL